MAPPTNTPRPATAVKLTLANISSTFKEPSRVNQIAVCLITILVLLILSLFTSSLVSICLPFLAAWLGFFTTKHLTNLADLPATGTSTSSTRVQNASKEERVRSLGKNTISSSIPSVNKLIVENERCLEKIYDLEEQNRNLHSKLTNADEEIKGSMLKSSQAEFLLNEKHAELVATMKKLEDQKRGYEDHIVGLDALLNEESEELDAARKELRDMENKYDDRIAQIKTDCEDIAKVLHDWEEEHLLHVQQIAEDHDAELKSLEEEYESHVVNLEAELNKNMTKSLEDEEKHSLHVRQIAECSVELKALEQDLDSCIRDRNQLKAKAAEDTTTIDQLKASAKTDLEAISWLQDEVVQKDSRIEDLTRELHDAKVEAQRKARETNCLFGRALHTPLSDVTALQEQLMDKKEEAENLRCLKDFLESRVQELSQKCGIIVALEDEQQTWQKTEADLEVRNKMLEKSLQESKAKISRLVNEVDVWKREAASTTSNWSDLKKELKHLKKEIWHIKQNTESLEDRIQRRNVTIMDLKRQNETLELDSSATKQQISNYKVAWVTLKDQLKDTSKQNKSLDTLTAKLVSENAAFKEEIHESLDEKSAAAERFCLIDSKLDTVEKRLSTYRKNIEHYQEEKAELKAENDSLAASVKELVAKVETLQAWKDFKLNLESEGWDMDKKLAEMGEERGDEEREQVALHETVPKMKATIEDVDDGLTERIEDSILSMSDTDTEDEWETAA